MTLRDTRTTLLLSAAAIVVLGSGLAGQKGAKAVDTPVTSILQTTGSIGASTNYRVQGDGLGAYINVSTRRPNDSVVSILQTSNTCCQDWELDAQGSITRTMLFDFRDPAPGTVVTDAPFAWALVPGRILVQCHLVGVNFPAMTFGQSLDCPVVMNFSASGNTYRISLGHDGQPGTDQALVTCTGVDGASKCNAWTVEPDATHDGELKNIGRLLRVVKNKLFAEGDFYFTFSFSVTRP